MAAIVASLLIVGLSWFGRWDITIAGGVAIAGTAAFVFGAPLEGQALPTFLVAALATQYRLGAIRQHKRQLREYRQLKAEVEGWSKPVQCEPTKPN